MTNKPKDVAERYRAKEWPAGSLYAVLQSAPDTTPLVEVLKEAKLTLELLQSKGRSAKLTLSIIDRALAANFHDLKEED